MYDYDQRPNTILSETVQRFMQDPAKHRYAVLCGRNNCGKSYLLKSLAQQLGETACYLGPARYQNFTTLGAYTPQKGQRRRSRNFSTFSSQWANQHQNLDNSPINLQTAIAELNDDQRAHFVEIMESLLGSRLEIKHIVENNKMSQQYISVDGHNVSFTSSGYRLIATLVTSLIDNEFETFLIDEPELGISPEAQGFFSDFLFDREKRDRYFPHIKSIIIATHSTIFLDREEITNNFFVEKRGDTIDVRQVRTISDINQIHFFLLGNRFESLYLPSAVVIVEGKTDHAFVERVIALRYPDAQMSVLEANNDSRIKVVFNIVKDLFGDIQKSPYRDRIFIVLDQTHDSSIAPALEKMGLPANNIVVWDKNGIEHYYPKRIVKQIFGVDGELVIEGDRIAVGEVSYTKNELSDKVVRVVEGDSEFNDEFTVKLLEKLDGVIGPD